MTREAPGSRGASVDFNDALLQCPFVLGTSHQSFSIRRFDIATMLTVGVIASCGGAPPTAGSTHQPTAALEVAARTRPDERQPHGTVTLHPGEVIGGSGDFEARFAVQMLRSHLDAVRACYEQELQHAPTAAGEVLVAFSINIDGSVSDVEVSRSSAPPFIAKCATETVAALHFNPGAEADFVRFAYPFVFAVER